MACSFLSRPRFFLSSNRLFNFLGSWVVWVEHFSSHKFFFLIYSQAEKKKSFGSLPRLPKKKALLLDRQNLVANILYPPPMVGALSVSTDVTKSCSLEKIIDAINIFIVNAPHAPQLQPPPGNSPPPAPPASAFERFSASVHSGSCYTPCIDSRVRRF